jgi:DNA-binding transcriptional MerR regulator
MNIGELARSAEVNIDTVRFYERRGVLPRPDRRPSGYRVYSNATVERLRLARALQSLGFTLNEIVGAFHASDRGGATCETERWRLEAVLERLDAKIRDLRRTRREVAEALDECAAGRCRFAGPKLLSSRPPGRLATSVDARRDRRDGRANSTN